LKKEEITKQTLADERIKELYSEAEKEHEASKNLSQKRKQPLENVKISEPEQDNDQTSQPKKKRQRK
jgi:hypothetical protein